MKPIAVIGFGVVSALGSGRDAVSGGEVGQKARSAIRPDPELTGAGLRRPIAARADVSEQAGRANALIRAAARQVAEQLTSSVPGYRSLRIGVALGTSSGDMQAQMEAFAALDAGNAVEPALARRANYFHPLNELVSALGVEPAIATNLLAACASSAIAIGLGCRWLEAERVDLVIAGGYDALSLFVASGFEALGATSAAPPQAFRQGRDGMVLGEGAALVLLMRSPPPAMPAMAFVTGFGATSDAVHVTAPDRTGRGLARAGTLALEDARVPASAVGLVSAHATATPFNDAAEARALRQIFGSSVRDVVVHAFKSSVGHTLGAAGALESVTAIDALAHSVLPATVGEGPLEPELEARLLERNESGSLQHCLKLAAAFGGANAALVLSKTSAGVARKREPVSIVAVGQPVVRLEPERLRPLLRCEFDKVARLDPLSELVVAAAAEVGGHFEELPRDATGVIVGSFAATLELNARFERRRRERGAALVEPRRFPPTSPNLPCGQCGIAFGLKGPAFSVGAGPGAGLEALLAAFDLLEAGDAEALLVVAADLVGPVVETLFETAGWPVPEPGALAVLLARGGHGVLLDREGLADLHDECRAGRGRLGAARPGWPALLQAVRGASP